MTDDPSDERDAQSEPGPPEQWLERIAESEGLSREEVVEQLVSSYWTLKEMYGLLEHTEGGFDGDSSTRSLGFDALPQEVISGDLQAISTRLKNLEESVAEVESSTETEELQGQVDMLADRIAAVEGKLGDRQETLEARFEEEFENLETILDYLINATDDLEGRLDTATEEQESDRALRLQQDRLVELKRLASKLGVRSAKCEYCDASVDIGLLPTPDCPQCDRRFTDIQPSTKWFGLGTDVLTVTEETYLDDSVERESRFEADDTREVIDRDNDTDSFEWGENRD